MGEREGLANIGVYSLRVNNPGRWGRGGGLANIGVHSLRVNHGGINGVAQGGEFDLQR